MSRSFRAVALAAALVTASACGSSTAPKTATPDIATTTFAPSLGVNLAAMTKMANGVYYRDLSVGTGAPIDTGSKVQVRYAGFLVDGSLFDQSKPTDAPFSFTLGAGAVIKGWDQGVVGMKLGGQRQLVIPPDLGYGQSGSTNIPSEAILVFVITVVGVS